MSIQTVAAEYKDVLTISFSALSFIIACTSLYFSCRTAWHDRSRLKITAHVVYESFDEEPYKIEVVVINVGRRDAVLEGMLCHYEKGISSYSSPKEGIVIKEKQRKKFELESSDLFTIDNEGDVCHLEDITILNVEGDEFRIPNSKKLIAKIKQGRTT
ncbi:hypothetical protein [Enterobacter ludwigii]|uniref:hypothetical protein n=1 Tax=Enterobacter ludwigii TaxID=299767 RepID=UPI002FCEA948